MRITWIVGLLLLLCACTPAPPHNVDNLCDIFDEYTNWYWITKKTQREWGVPINVQMAIIHQESKFNGKAKPDRTKVLWVIPWTRPSSAYGYSQALVETWQDYKKKSGNNGDRDNFAAASDFIGWYGQQAHTIAGINRGNAYQLYLAYHEGITGFQKKTYLNKKWLINVAHKVSARANRYQIQLKSCEKKFRKKWWQVI